MENDRFTDAERRRYRKLEVCSRLDFSLKCSTNDPQDIAYPKPPAPKVYRPYVMSEEVSRLFGILGAS